MDEPDLKVDLEVDLPSFQILRVLQNSSDRKGSAKNNGAGNSMQWENPGLNFPAGKMQWRVQSRMIRDDMDRFAVASS